MWRRLVTDDMGRLHLQQTPGVLPSMGLWIHEAAVRPAVGRAGGRLTLASFRVNRGASIVGSMSVISTLLIHYDLLRL
jgi:hypothetical protein